MRTCNIARTACILLAAIAMGCAGARSERGKGEVTMNGMSIRSEEHSVSALAEEMNGKIKVKIDGAVFHPGEYIMDEGSSLGDLMDMAEVDSLASHRMRKRHRPMRKSQYFRIFSPLLESRLFSRDGAGLGFRIFSLHAIPWPPATPSRIPSEPAFPPAAPSPTAAVLSHRPPRGPSSPSAPTTPPSPPPRTS